MKVEIQIQVRVQTQMEIRIQLQVWIQTQRRVQFRSVFTIKLQYIEYCAGRGMNVWAPNILTF